MIISYDTFTTAFLDKISEYEFVKLSEINRTEIVDGYMKRALSRFKSVSPYDFYSTADDDIREFNIDSLEDDVYLDEIVDIVTDGMIVQWLKPYTYKQDILEISLNTKDISTYSSAELLNRITALYKETKKSFVNAIREYSFDNGRLDSLHL